MPPVPLHLGTHTVVGAVGGTVYPYDLSLLCRCRDGSVNTRRVKLLLPLLDVATETLRCCYYI